MRRGLMRLPCISLAGLLLAGLVLAGLLLAGLVLTSGLARADACPGPAGFEVSSGALPAVKAALAGRSLTVLALGGAATGGGAARGEGFTYPARLEARLRAALPGVAVRVLVDALPRRTDAEVEARLAARLAEDRPALVIWAPGATSAARGEDMETFGGVIAGTIARIRASGADLILMTGQYAPSLARLINLPAYRAAVLHAGDEAGVPVLDRYDLMRAWNDSGFLALDSVDAAARVRVARVLFDCLAEKLVRGIVDGGL